MADILAYVDAILNLTLGFMMIVIMGFLIYLLGLALVTMVKNKQPRWDAIAYVIAILVMGLAMWRYFPTVAIKTMRISLQEARPEAELLQEEVRRWIPSFEVTLPTPTPVPEPPMLPTYPMPPTPLIVVTPTSIIAVTDGITVTVAPPATPYPTYTPYPTFTVQPTPAPSPTLCVVQIYGNWIPCPPTPPIGGE